MIEIECIKDAPTCAAISMLAASHSHPHLSLQAESPSSSFASLMDEDEEGEYYEDEGEEGDVIKVKATAELDPSLMIENLGLCQESIDALEKRGIKALFAIQKAVFEPAVEGRDLIGRAKTGSGKTLAFALPVIESIVKVRELRLFRKHEPPYNAEEQPILPSVSLWRDIDCSIQHPLVIT